MKKLLSLFAVLALAVTFCGTCALRAQDDDHGQTSNKPEEMTPAQKVQQDSYLREKIELLLPEGVDAVEAAEGFKELEQFVASAHLSKNLDITFDKLKAEVVGPAEGKLDKALSTLKPDMSEDRVREEVAKAQRQTAEVIEAASREAQEAQMAKAAAPEEEEEEEGDNSPAPGQP